MGALIPLLAVLGAFGLPMYIAKLRHEEKTRRLELEARSRGGVDDDQVKLIVEENRLLRERVENLESIVCSVDFELNQKLAKVIDEQRSVLQLAPAAPGAPAVAGVGAAPAAQAAGAPAAGAPAAAVRRASAPARAGW